MLCVTLGAIGRPPIFTATYGLILFFALVKAFSNIPLTPLQTIMFDYRGIVLKATVRSVSTLEGAEGDTMGIIMEGTDINWFKDPASSIKLKNTNTRK